jgi:quinol monooxygenase YgiN
MIFVLATMVTKKGKNKEFLKSTEDLIKSTRLEEGSISYNLYSSTEDDNIFIMIEQWENEEYLDKHLQTDHFKSFVENTSNILARDIDINKYSVS